MKTFTESLRYEYPLTPDSLVVDVGAFDGSWSRDIAKRYNCRVIAFEPIHEHYVQAVCNTTGTNVCVINAALAMGGSEMTLGVSNNSSGKWSKGDPEIVPVVHILPFLNAVGPIALLKKNCEGCEYELLEYIIATKAHHRIDNIQVQFHNCVPDYSIRYNNICEALEKTHEQEWNSGFLWSNFKKR